MSVDVFRQVLDKIKHDNIGQSTLIVLYNWGEPLIHPEIGKIIRMIHEYGFNTAISSNFNVDIDLKTVVSESPSYFRVSLSGYSQAIYEQTHRNGNINLVVSNLYRLRHYMDKFKKNINVEVYYHLYKHNCREDFLKIKEISERLNFRFNTQFAYYMPVEKILSYLSTGSAPPEDQPLIDNLLVRPEEQAAIAMPYVPQTNDCGLRRDMIPINWDGSVALCCGIYDYGLNVAPNFLELSHDEIQQRRYAHPLCGPCMSRGVPLMGENLPPEGARRLRELGNARLAEANSPIRFAV